MAHDTGTPVGGSNRGIGFIYTILSGIVWIGQVAAWLIIPILVIVLMSVVLSVAKVGTVFQWESDVFLFGSKLTASSFGDLQWHLFGVMLMLTMASALVTDSHVRVDFMRQHMSEKQKHIVDILGHLIFLVPLCVVIIYHGYDFTLRSFNLNEGSNYDGLYDRFALKVFIPISFSLMLLAGIGLTVQSFLTLFKPVKGPGSD